MACLLTPIGAKMPNEIPIPATTTSVVNAVPRQVFDRWAIESQTVRVTEDGEISLSAKLVKANATKYSPLPADRVSISDPKLHETAANDEVLGPLLIQRVSIDLQIAKRILELREII